MKKLCFLADTLLKEEKLIELGINTFVYKDVVEEYIENVADKVVKIVELSRYMREVPDELVSVIEKTKNIFDEFYVIFTDYTGSEERKVEKERRDKDPILFGVFKNATNVADRFYFLGDWVDEFCDLTLDKMIEQYQDKYGISPTHKTEIPNTTEELIEILKSYKIDDSEDRSYITLDNESTVPVGTIVQNPIPVGTQENNQEEKKTSFFDKVRSVFKKNVRRI